jgi:hypothetical protein
MGIGARKMAEQKVESICTHFNQSASRSSSFLNVGNVISTFMKPTPRAGRLGDHLKQQHRSRTVTSFRGIPSILNYLLTLQTMLFFIYF